MKRPTINTERRAQQMIYRRVIARADADRSIATSVAAAREHGVSWRAIGAALGLTRSSAMRRYGPRRNSAPREPTQPNSNQLGLFEPTP